MKDFLEKYSEFVTKRPWFIIGAIAVISAVMAAFLPPHLDFSPEPLLEADDPNILAYHRFNDTFGRDDNRIIVAVTAPNIFDAELLRAIERFTAEMKELEIEFEGKPKRAVIRAVSVTNVADIRNEEGELVIEKLLDMKNLTETELAKAKERGLDNPLLKRALISEDGRSAGIVIDVEHFINLDRCRKSFIEELDKKIEILKSVGGVEVARTGIPIIRNEYAVYVKNDNERYLPLITLLFMIVLYATFRNLRSVILPMLAVNTAVLWAAGLMALLDIPINIVNNVILPLVAIIGLADSIHLIAHYEEELSLGFPVKDAVKETIKRLAVACFLTSITSAVGFASLATAHVKIIKEFGLISALGIMLAYVVTISLLPAALSLLKPPKNLARRKAVGLSSGLFDRIIIISSKYKFLILVISSTFFCAALLGMTRLEVRSAIMEDLTEGSEVSKSLAYISEHLVGPIPFEVIIKTKKGGALEPDVLKGVWELQKNIEGYEGVTYTQSPASFIERLHRKIHNDRPKTTLPESREAAEQLLLLYTMDGNARDIEELLTESRDMQRISAKLEDIGSVKMFELEGLVNEWAGELLPDGVTIEVTGESILATSILQGLVEDMLKSFISAFFFIFIILLAVFRDFRMTLIAMAPTTLPVLVTMGLMGFMGITLRTSTVIVFSVSLGIAVDDAIHFLARYRSEYRGQSDPLLERMERTLRSTGVAIIYTSIVLIFGFTVLMTSAFKASVVFAMLVAVTVTTALLACLFMLPALIAVFQPRFASEVVNAHREGESAIGEEK